MVATCQVDNCGVVAIARCSNPGCQVPGGAAFCLSHGTIGGHCGLCLRVTKERIDDIAARCANARNRIRVMAELLTSEGFSPPNRYFRATATKTNWRGKVIEVDDPAADGYGWPVGIHEWVWSVEVGWPHNNRQERRGRRQLFVNNNGEIIAHGNRSASGRPAVSSQYAFMQGPEIVEFWDGIVERMADIVRSHGLTVPS
ncbi:hypothetical protein ACFFX1_17200 [Dactylosporangium sucinum]|uniref:Uncharacterized protein n=1 Tax=Dactylosporangium sucinum TaxID=1424081 RepID=A0A917X349_9ACTN|nr:hypothetical protein [Dactylosporangium sucinum]GGM57607.1 hypothetical protein GCM10007977_069070 [Dactylosporangium sucinum]